MKNILNKIKKNKKGFTLVEILVVLVIMAILAAAAIPTMIGFIDQARGKAYIAQARTVYVASQAAVSEQYGIDKTALPASITETSTDAVGTNVLAMVDSDLDGATYTVTIDKTAAKVTAVEFKKNGWTVTMNTVDGSVSVTN